MTRASPTRLYTLTEAAAHLHETVSVSTLRKLVREGRLTATRIGKRYYVTDADLESMQERCRASASPRASTGAPQPEFGSSATETWSGGRDAALASLRRLSAR